MTFDECVEELNSASREGDYLRAIDACRDAAEKAPNEMRRERMRIEEVVLLARIASLKEATEKYEEYKLHTSADSDARSLLARINKDLAFEVDGPERQRRLTASLIGYRKVLGELHPGWDQQKYEFNGINVATLSYFLKREFEDSSWWVKTQRIRDVIRRFRPLDNYWSMVTQAELHLIEEQDERAAAAIQKALQHPDSTPDKQLATLKQFIRINEGSAATRALTNGPCLHYSGHMISPPGSGSGRFLAQHERTVAKQIEDQLMTIRPSAVYGSLASGVDILVLEAVHGMNAREPGKIDVNLFLPFREADFNRESIAPAGGEWSMRARALLTPELAKKTRFLSMDRAWMDDPLAFHLTSHHAMGTAILEAKRSGRRAAQLVAWDGQPPTGPAGAAADRAAWPKADDGRFKQYEINLSPYSGTAKTTQSHFPAPKQRYHARCTRALVFGDVKNFSKLNEVQLPIFVRLVLGALSAAFNQAERGGVTLHFSNTWGDGVFAVFESASGAASFALDLQDRMERLMRHIRRVNRRGVEWLPDNLAIRLGLHFGAVYQMHEPVTGEDNFFGEAVARAARIEPITKEGRIFVSEEFASELALDPDSPAEAEYVGEKDAAKNYGRFRLYRIRPRTR